VLPKGSQTSLPTYLRSHFSHSAISTTCKTQLSLWTLCVTFVRCLRWHLPRPAISHVMPSSAPRAVPSAILRPGPSRDPVSPCSSSNLHYTATLENRLQAIISLITTYCALVIYVRVSTCRSVSWMPTDTNTERAVPPHTLLSAEFLQPVFSSCCSVHQCAQGKSNLNMKFIAPFI